MPSFSLKMVCMASFIRGRHWFSAVDFIAWHSRHRAMRFVSSSVPPNCNPIM